MHAVLQGPGEDPLADPETTDGAWQAGTHLPRAVHPHAVPRLSRVSVTYYNRQCEEGKKEN